MAKKFDDKFSRFVTVHECDRQTDRRTELPKHIRRVMRCAVKMRTFQLDEKIISLNTRSIRTYKKVRSKKVYGDVSSVVP